MLPYPISLLLTAVIITLFALYFILCLIFYIIQYLELFFFQTKQEILKLVKRRDLCKTILNKVSSLSFFHFQVGFLNIPFDKFYEKL